MDLADREHRYGRPNAVSDYPLLPARSVGLRPHRAQHKDHRRATSQAGTQGPLEASVAHQLSSTQSRRGSLGPVGGSRLPLFSGSFLHLGPLAWISSPYHRLPPSTRRAEQCGHPHRRLEPSPSRARRSPMSLAHDRWQVEQIGLLLPHFDLLNHRRRIAAGIAYRERG